MSQCRVGSLHAALEQLWLSKSLFMYLLSPGKFYRLKRGASTLIIRPYFIIYFPSS